LIKGLEYLLPLTQKQLALELDIGESTLSRLIKNKYMETPKVLSVKRSDSQRLKIGLHFLFNCVALLSITLAVRMFS
jgi:RNA polymerase sigma-54 factor